MEIRHNLHSDLRRAIGVVEDIDSKFQTIFNRGGNPFVETYRCDDAEFIAICLGSLSYQLRDVVDVLREEGIRVGVTGLRLYRPFPHQAVAETLSRAAGVIVFEKALSYGNQGALFGDIKSALYNADQRPKMHNYILGLGGREIKTGDLLTALRNSCKNEVNMNNTPDWIGLKL